jgi:hypothetical protein
MVGKLYLQAALTESNTDVPKSKYEEDLKELFQHHLERVTNKLLQSGCDPMGLGNHFRSQIPFDKLANWRSDYYPNLKISYDVHVEINNLGSLVQEE